MKTKKKKKSVEPKIKNNIIKIKSASANFDVIALPYYLLWYLPEHIPAIADEYSKYLEENLNYILTGKER